MVDDFLKFSFQMVIVNTSLQALVHGPAGTFLIAMVSQVDPKHFKLVPLSSLTSRKSVTIISCELFNNINPIIS